ncbi:MAG: hypothetical protein JWM80_3860 [Cyanobacteria bacterium RYN_339]|nr:hypothetical protein [Cyanobacteria bacterium RYN_339]
MTRFAAAALVALMLLAPAASAAPSPKPSGTAPVLAKPMLAKPSPGKPTMSRPAPENLASPKPMPAKQKPRPVGAAPKATRTAGGIMWTVRASMMALDGGKTLPLPKGIRLRATASAPQAGKLRVRIEDRRFPKRTRARTEGWVPAADLMGRKR